MTSAPTGRTGPFPPARFTGRRAVVAAVMLLSALALSPAFSPLAAAKPLSSPSATAAPTMTVKPNKGLIGNQNVKVVGKNWSAVGTVGVSLCEGSPGSGTGPCTALAPQQPTGHGSWSVTDEPLVGPNEVCETACYFEATQGATVLDVVMSVRTASLTLRSRGGDCCYIGQTVMVSGSNFPAGDTIHIETCSSENIGCETDAASSAVASPKGGVKFSSSALDVAFCSEGQYCYLLATDPTYGNGQFYVDLQVPVYCGPIACPSLDTRK